MASFTSFLPMESVHPLMVHFPIALLLTALLLDGLALALKRPGLHRVALWNLSLGTLGAAVAVRTGLWAAEIAKHTFEIHQVLELHRKLGIATLILGGGTHKKSHCAATRGIRPAVSFASGSDSALAEASRSVAGPPYQWVRKPTGVCLLYQEGHSV